MLQRPPNFRLNPHASLAKGLVFAGLGGFNCARTLRYADSSGYGNHGTLTNMDPPTDWVWVPELGRWGLDFDGSNDYATGTMTNGGTGSVTVAAWCKRAWGTASYDFALGLNYYQESGVGLAAATGDTSQDWVARDLMLIGNGWGGGRGPRTIAAPPSMTANTWHHLAGVLSPGSAQIYVDNVAQSMRVATVGSVPATTTTGYVGLSRTAYGDYFAGVLCDVLMWSRALSPAEIAAAADPSNTMLSGLLLPPRRRIWPVAAATGKPTHFMHYQRMRA